MDQARILLAVAGAFILGYLIGGAVEIAKVIAIMHGLAMADLPAESRGDLRAMLVEPE